MKHLPTDSDIDEGFRKPGVANDPDDIDNDVDDEIYVELGLKTGSIMGGEDRLLSSSVPNSQRHEAIISPEEKGALHVKFDFNQHMDLDQNPVLSEANLMQLE